LPSWSSTSATARGCDGAVSRQLAALTTLDLNSDRSGLPPEMGRPARGAHGARPLRLPLTCSCFPPKEYNCFRGEVSPTLSLSRLADFPSHLEHRLPFLVLALVRAGLAGVPWSIDRVPAHLCRGSRTGQTTVRKPGWRRASSPPPPRRGASSTAFHNAVRPSP
jgi:hypothetical protein